MLNINKSIEYALIALRHINDNQDKSPYSAKQISSTIDFNRSISLSLEFFKNLPIMPVIFNINNYNILNKSYISNNSKF